MPIRFNMQELINDLIAEGVGQPLAVAKAKKEYKKRQKNDNLLTCIKARNDFLMKRTNTIPKMFSQGDLL